MRKFLILLLTFILATMVFTGCSNDSVSPLENTGGEIVKDGNGSFLVEKGDYIYFINGKSSTTSNNDFGTPNKGSLVRMKKSDLSDIENAKVETVLPKIMLTNSYKTGVYMYGDYVYYATPSTVKDKQGNVKNSETEFNKLNLKTGKVGEAIAYSTSNSVEYRYVERNNKVYLTFTFTKTEDSVENKYFKVYNATDNKLVYTSKAYNEMLMAEDNSESIYFTTYSQGIKEDEKATFQDVYRYNVGDSKETLVVSGTGSEGKNYHNRKEYTEDLLFEESGIQGLTISLIKNTGKYLIFKIKTLDSVNVSSFYYGVDVSNKECNFQGKVNLGASNANTTDKAFTANSIYESLDSVYYIETSENSSAGLVKFDYTKLLQGGISKGKTLISADCKGYAIYSIVGDYMYLADTATGNYYRCNYKGEEVEVLKINPVSMETATDWYAPRIVSYMNGETQKTFFIGLVNGDYFKDYVFAFDITNIGSEEYESELEKYKDVSKATRDDMLSLIAKRIGKITSSDKNDVNDLLDEDYPVEEE